MKNTNRIFIVSTAPMTDDEIQLIENNLSSKFHNRIQFYDWERDNQTGFIDLKADEHPDKDEVSMFIDEMDEAGFGTFWGVPLEDYSNDTMTDDYRTVFYSELNEEGNLIHNTNGDII